VVGPDTGEDPGGGKGDWVVGSLYI
jgi:hypothetical protein